MKSIGQLIVSYTGNVVSLTINLLWMWWWFCIWFVLFISFINCAFINLEDSHFYAIYLSCPTCVMCKSCHIVCWSYPILYLVKNKIVILYQWILSYWLSLCWSKFPFFTLFQGVLKLCISEDDQTEVNSMHTLEASVRSVLALTRNSQTETPLDQETKVLHKGIRMQLYSAIVNF